MASNARRGLDLLLAHYPEHDIVQVSNQSLVADDSRFGYWTLVTLSARSVIASASIRGIPDPDAGPRWPERREARFAIWNTTGAVYDYDLENPAAVSDDPFLTL